MKFNDLNMEEWKDLDINVDSLWLINQRDKSGKHNNIYHGNFIPQIPYQLISRYTKENEAVLDVFMGSGTTLFVCEELNRKFIGLDINEDMISYVSEKMEQFPKDGYSDYCIHKCDSTDTNDVELNLNSAFKKLNCSNVDFIIMHPPYLDIIRFTENNSDLSHISDLNTFVNKFLDVCYNTLKYLKKDKYFGIVIGDVYKNSEVIPLGFYIMDAIKRKFKVKLKGIVIKNIEGNRGKIGKGGIWKYRALRSDYFIFKHEYILVFKKEF